MKYMSKMLDSGQCFCKVILSNVFKSTPVRKDTEKEKIQLMNLLTYTDYAGNLKVQWMQFRNTLSGFQLYSCRSWCTEK